MIVYTRTDSLCNMAKNKQSLDHARHNDKALKHLNKTPAFLDWVVTMCFYSSLHFVRYKIFPLSDATERGDKFSHQTFDTYAKFYKYRNSGKHEMLLDLVVQECPDIAAEYNNLKDMCWSARYTNFQIDREMSDLALKHQKKIKDYCDPPEPTAEVTKYVKKKE